MPLKILYNPIREEPPMWMMPSTDRENCVGCIWSFFDPADKDVPCWPCYNDFIDTGHRTYWTLRLTGDMDEIRNRRCDD